MTPTGAETASAGRGGTHAHAGRFGPTRLALRLALAGGPRSIRRLLLMGLGPALGVLLLLSVLSAYSVLTSQDSKRAARYGEIDQNEYSKGQRDVTLRWTSAPHSGGNPSPQPRITPSARGQFHRESTTSRGPASSSLLPPSSDSCVGRQGASFDLAFRGGRRHDLPRWAPRTGRAGRLRRRPSTGSGPAEYRLSASDALVTESFVGVRAERFGLVLVLVLVLLALLVPTLVLISTAARLSAATRDSRIAAVRLIGASRRELRYLLTVETCLVATIGSVVGVLAFVLARALLR